MLRKYFMRMMRELLRMPSGLLSSPTPPTPPPEAGTDIILYGSCLNNRHSTSRTASLQTLGALVSAAP